VYELLQVNLFPGARYSFKLKVSKDLANFVRRYFTEDDEEDEGQKPLSEFFLV